MTEPAAPSRRDIWVDLLLYPGQTLPTAAAPVIVAVGLAVHDHVFAPAPLLLAFLASWLIHVGGVFTDNYVLISQHPDVPEHPELLAAPQERNADVAWSRGWRSSPVLPLAVLPGPYLLHVAGIPVVVLGAIGIVASLGYSLAPIP